MIHLWASRNVFHFLRVLKLGSTTLSSFMLRCDAGVEYNEITLVELQIVNFKRAKFLKSDTSHSASSHPPNMDFGGGTCCVPIKSYHPSISNFLSNRESVNANSILCSYLYVYAADCFYVYCLFFFFY